MKKILDEYKEIILYTICGVLIILSSYTIIINFNHAKYLNKTINISELDTDLKIYKDNVLKIEDVSKSTNNNYLKRLVYLLKNDGLYKKIPGDKLKYEDLYYLNNYFLDTIINDGYIGNFQTNIEFIGVYDEYINNLIFNANYVGREIENNSNYQYDVLNNEVRDVMIEQYKMILNIYRDFSYIILEMCDSL